MGFPEGFGRLVRESFAFLVTQYGFQLDHLYEGDRESSARYVSERSRVTLDADCFPVVISSAVGLFVPGSRNRLVDEYGLWLIVRDRAPDEEARLVSGNLSLEETLRLHAELMARYADDLLRGETHRIPRLQRMRAEATRKDNKERFGTSTGETPRFDHRPTLEELFAGADEDELKVPRSYQAYWDYAYTLTEIAHFLGRTVREVQLMLDDWDRVDS